MRPGSPAPTLVATRSTAALRMCICAVGTLPGYSVLTSGAFLIRTATGSVYGIDLDAEIWQRVPTLGSGRLRGERGTILAFHHAGLGRSAVLECPPLVSGSERRVIVTSALVAIERGVDRSRLGADVLAGVPSIGHSARVIGDAEDMDGQARETTEAGPRWE